MDPLAATMPALPSCATLSPGDVVAGRYRVEERLGEGGMGVVYRVQHVHVGKSFALKVLGESWARTPDAFARFEREARAAGGIASPHVAQATDFGRLADGSCFLVLEYIDGRTLRSVLKRGALPPGRALRIARGIVAAMEAAHSIGVIHRDLKPENIMLVDHDGDPDYVKVLDFGVAKVEDREREGASSSALTRQGAVVGTPAYMSPEQAVGERVDARSDLYAVGIILFEMLAGKCPFRGDHASVLRQHVLDDPPPLSRGVRRKLNVRVATLLERLLAKAPGARYPGAAEVGVALEECLATSAPGDRGAVSMGNDVITTAGDASSRLGWLSALVGRVGLRREPRQPRVAWPSAMIDRLRAWRRRRRLRALLAVPAALVDRVRARLARRGLRLTAWQVSSGLVIVLVALLVCVAAAAEELTDARKASATTCRGALRGFGESTLVGAAVPAARGSSKPWHR